MLYGLKKAPSSSGASLNLKYFKLGNAKPSVKGRDEARQPALIHTGKTHIL
jgi:hypothetical protein